MDCSSECTQLLSTQETKNLNIMIHRCVNNLSTPHVDLRAQIVAEHAQTVKYNLSTLHRQLKQELRLLRQVLYAFLDDKAFIRLTKKPKWSGNPRQIILKHMVFILYYLLQPRMRIKSPFSWRVTCTCP